MKPNRYQSVVATGGVRPRLGAGCDRYWGRGAIATVPGGAGCDRYWGRGAIATVPGGRGTIATVVTLTLTHSDSDSLSHCLATGTVWTGVATGLRGNLRWSTPRQ